MKEKRQRKQCWVMSLFLIALSLGSCGQKEKPSSSVANVDFALWSAPSSLKVFQDPARTEQMIHEEARFSAEMIQNEKESAQLIVTSPKEATLHLTVNDLRSGDNVFPASQMEVYFQRYLTIETASNGSSLFQAGDRVPDFLLPQEYAVKRAQNVVKANQNQGLTVDFDSANVAPGHYEGNFTLEVGNDRHEIPVSVDVASLSLTGRRNFQSCFLVYGYQLLQGEYDNSATMVDAYLDVLNDFKANGYVVHDDEVSNMNWFLNEVKTRYTDLNTSSICIPYDFPLTYQASPNNTPVQYIVALAKMSDETNFYLDDAFFYPGAYDEADIVEERANAVTAFLGENGSYQKTLEYAVQELEDEGFFSSQSAAYAKRIKDAILSIPAVFTNVNFREDWVHSLHASFCPYISLYQDRATAARYQDAAKKRGSHSLWSYSCSGPLSPYPTFHIDDSLLTMRSQGWMDVALGLNGFLYYEVNKYSIPAEENGTFFVDPYETAARYDTINGDGFLLYPGRYYGSDHPFPSLRLMAYRDSMDDYDLLEAYQNALNQAKTDYAIDESLSVNDFVYDLYDELFSGVTAQLDDKKYLEIRHALMARLSAFTSNGFLALPKEDGSYDLYAKEANLTIDGQSITGETAGTGYRYSLAKGGNITIQAGDHKVTLNLPVKQTLNSLTSLDGLSQNDASRLTLASNGVLAQIESEKKESGSRIGSASRLFHPYVSLPLSNLDHEGYLCLSYENSGDNDARFDLVVLDGQGNKETLSSEWIATGDSKEIRLPLNNISMKKSDIHEIRLSFDNVGTEDGTSVLLPTRKILLKQMYAEKKEDIQ